MSTICTLQPGDDLAPLLGEVAASLRWNPVNVYVAEAPEGLVGVAVVFDGGHDIVFVDYVRVLPHYEGRGLWLRFLRRIREDARARGCKSLYGYANNSQVLAIAVRCGARIDNEPHYGIAMGIDDGN